MATQRSENVIKHPYYPLDLELPHYVPNENDVFLVPISFFGLVVGLALVVWVYSGKQTWRFSLGDRMKVCWFTMCAVIHTILEGYFSIYHATMAGRQSYLAQICTLMVISSKNTLS